MANVSIGVTAKELFACNPFRVLGVAVNAHSNEIEEAYKKLSSLAASGQQDSYRTAFDFNSLPKVSRSAADVNTAYGKLSSNGYRCFAYSDPQFTVALTIDDVALNLQDISCYDCFLRCYMWLVINDRAFEYPEMWILLAKYIDNIIDSQPSQWADIFGDRFPSEMIGQGGQAFASLHQTFCEIILLPVKEMVRGSIKCQRAMDILRVAKIDVDAPYMPIDIPQANKPLAGQPQPKLKLAVQEGEMVGAPAENNDFGNMGGSSISIGDIAAPGTPQAAPAPAQPAPAPSPAVMVPPPTPVRPAAPTPAPTPVAPAPAPITPPPAPAPTPAAPAPSIPRPAAPAPAPVAPPPAPRPAVQPTTVSPVSLTQPSAPQPAVPQVSLTQPAPAAPASAPVQTAPQPAPAPTPVPHFDPIQQLDNNGPAQQVSLGGRVTPAASGGIQTSTLMSAEDIAAEEEEQSMYTDTLIQLLRSSTNSSMKAVDTKHAFNNGDIKLEDGFQHTNLAMDELKVNSKLYDEKNLTSGNEPPKTFEQKYKNINIDDMLNPKLVGAEKAQTIDPVADYFSKEKNFKKAGHALVKLSLVAGFILVVVVTLIILDIL